MAKEKGRKDQAAVKARDGTDAEAGSQPQAGGGDAQQEVTAKIANLRSHVRESFGKVVMSMMMLPRYRHQTLGDLQHLVLEPLIRDRVAIAQRGGDDMAQQDIAGVAIWASVSDEAEGRIRDQIKGGAWPLRLKADDWNSGSNNWLIDVIAADQRATASVIANFRQVVKDGSLKLHPLITRLVDEETLQKMGAQKSPGGDLAGEGEPQEVPKGETVN